MKSGTSMALWLGVLLLAPAAAMAGDDKAKLMDTDGDGMVSSAEHAAGAKTMFTQMDTNSDGKVTAAEMDAFHASKMAGKGDKMKMSSAEKIKKIDTDGDGSISAAEHDAGSAQMFTRMDANGDGNLTAAEMKAGHDKEMRSAKSGP